MGKRSRANSTRIANLQQGVKKKREDWALRDSGRSGRVGAMQVLSEEGEDEGEVVLWDNVVVEDGSDGDIEGLGVVGLGEDFDSDGDEVSSVDGVGKAGGDVGLSLRWGEGSSNIEKYRGKDRERKARYRAKIDLEKLAKSAAGSANILSMFERARKRDEVRLSVRGVGELASSGADGVGDGGEGSGGSIADGSKSTGEG